MSRRRRVRTRGVAVESRRREARRFRKPLAFRPLLLVDMADLPFSMRRALLSDPCICFDSIMHMHMLHDSNNVNKEESNNVI